MGLPNDRKYTDEDVRSSDELQSIAYHYAFHYQGNWDFLVAASYLANETRELPVAVARAVLNAMRADPQAEYRLPRRELQGRRDPFVDANKSPEVTILKRSPYVIATNFKYPLVKSDHKTAFRYHVLRLATEVQSMRYHYGHHPSGYSKLVWFPAPKKAQVFFNTWCSASWCWDIDLLRLRLNTLDSRRTSATLYPREAVPVEDVCGNCLTNRRKNGVNLQW